MMRQNKKYMFPSSFHYILIDTDQWNSSKSDMKYMFLSCLQYIQTHTPSTNRIDMSYTFQSYYHCNLTNIVLLDMCDM